jgi:maltoporin
LSTWRASGGSLWKIVPAVVAWCVLLLPGTAAAGLMGDRVEVTMYGRIGVAWSPSGEVITGRSMNLLGNPIGGRFEEGDYLEPTIKFHILKPEKPDTEPWIQAVLTPAIFARNGSFLSAFSNGFDQTMGTEIFQAYLEAGNILLPDLKLWAGARFYRGGDVHIADYFYFNNLSTQGAGVKYKGLDVAVLLETSKGGANNALYALDVDLDNDADLQRQRTVLVGQYILPFGAHSLHGLAEVHFLPELRSTGIAADLPTDVGFVAGVKGHLALPNDGFNDLSIRYGYGLANGSIGGAQTWNTFGATNASGTYAGAGGLELVDHFLYNFGQSFSLNGYGILHWAKGASTAATDSALDFAVGARGTIYLTDYFHLLTEATFQGARTGDQPLSAATKLSLVPTIVPSGQRSVWARPHLRFIYTVAIYNGWAQQLYVSPFLATDGIAPVGHFFGARAEWWF